MTEYFDIATGQALDESDLHERYNDMLDECNPVVCVGSQEFNPSHVLKECDPTGWRCGFADWLDAETGETLQTDDWYVETVRADAAARGTAAGSWVTFDSPEHAQRIIDGERDGDPEVMDMCPSPLSGEWADDPIPADVLGELNLDEDHELADDLLSEYESAYSEAWWAEVIRAAQISTATVDAASTTSTTGR